MQKLLMKVPRATNTLPSLPTPSLAYRHQHRHQHRYQRTIANTVLTLPPTLQDGGEGFGACTDLPFASLDDSDSDSDSDSDGDSDGGDGEEAEREVETKGGKRKGKGKDDERKKREGKREGRREGNREGKRDSKGLGQAKAKAEATPLAHAVARYLTMSNLHALASRASQREGSNGGHVSHGHGGQEGSGGDGGGDRGKGKGKGESEGEGGDEHGLGDNSEVKILNLLLAAGADRLAAVNQPILGSPRVSDEKCFALLRHVLRPLYVYPPGSRTLNLLRSKLGEAGADRLIRYQG